MKRHNKKPLGEVATGQFRALVFQEVRVRATAALLELITRDRNREEVDRELLRDAVQIYVDMGMGSLKTYQADFEGQFLQVRRLRLPLRMRCPASQSPLRSAFLCLTALLVRGAAMCAGNRNLLCSRGGELGRVGWRSRVPAKGNFL